MTQEPRPEWQMWSDPELKRRFALECRKRPDNDAGRFEAACMVFPNQIDTPLAWRAAQEWRFDPVVIAEMAELAKAEDAADLPSKEEQARDIYRLASDKTLAVDDRLKAHKLYADLQGYVQKPGAGGAQVYVDNRRVMMMPHPANSTDDWEAQATKHQTKLVIDATSTLANR